MIAHQGPRRRLALVSITSAALSLSLTPSYARADDAAATSDVKDPDHAPMTLDFSGYLGGSIRLGGAPSGAIIDRTGLSAGGAITLTPSRSFAIEIAYEHVDLGLERLGNDGVGSADVRRDADAIWADARVHPYFRPSFAIYTDLGVGLAWQGADARGLVGSPLSDGSRSVSLFGCKASAPASVGLRAKVGIEAPLGGGLLFMTDASIENVRFSGELLDGCISGAGTTSLFAIHAGLGARIDLSALFSR